VCVFVCSLPLFLHRFTKDVDVWLERLTTARPSDPTWTPCRSRHLNGDSRSVHIVVGKPSTGGRRDGKHLGRDCVQTSVRLATTREEGETPRRNTDLGGTGLVEAGGNWERREENMNTTTD